MASTSQRRRQLARQRWEKQQARRTAAAARARRRRLVLAVVLVVVLVIASVAAAVVWWPWSGADDATTATPAETESPGTGACVYTPTQAAGPPAGLPPAEPIAATSATLTIDGAPVTVELLPDVAPCTVGSLAHLAANDYFDGTTCHRLTTSETLNVLQCGDPTGSGAGDPGYQFGIENTEGATYPAGTVAMARGDDPGTNGSQFFVVYGDSELPPTPGYTVFGRVTDGLDVVRAIAERGTADGSTDGAPAQPVTLGDLVTAP